MKSNFKWFGVFLFLVIAQASTFFFRVDADAAAEKGSTDKQLRDQLLGNLMRGRLEMMHVSQKKIDTEFSRNAFKLYLEHLDANKQFLLQADVKSLEKYREHMGDMLNTGDFSILNESRGIMDIRLKEVEKIVDDIFAKPFDFTKDEMLESDPKKRDYPKDMQELRSLWVKMLKYSVLTKYLSSIEAQDEADKALADKNAKNAKKTKVKKEKKKTAAELEKEAIDDTKKNFKMIFSRLRQEDHDDELERLLNSISMVFDPHTNYFPPQKKEDFDIEMKGSLEGIGAMLRPDGAYIKVEKIIPGSAAWKQGQLDPEDTILKVGQAVGSPVDIVNMRINDAVKLIRGPKGTEVRLTVKKASGQMMVIPIIREVVEIEDGYAKGAVIQEKSGGPKVGYIYLPKFYRDFEAQTKGEKVRNCTEDVKHLIDVFNKNNVDGLILDLRNNSGGALEDARYMTGLFVPEGPVVQVKQGPRSTDILYSGDTPLSFRKHVVVLINRFSASASEIVAAALQDYGRAIIIGGDHSHGKGTVQVLLNLDQGLGQIAKDFLPLGAMKITIQKFYRINGGSTQYKGVIPDIILPDVYGYMETGEKYLDYSLPWDEVSPVSYKKWAETQLALPDMIKKSQERVKVNKKFTNLAESVKVLQERRKDTVVPLSMQKMKEEQIKVKADADRLKLDDVNSNLIIKPEKKGNLITVDLDALEAQLKLEKNANKKLSAIEKAKNRKKRNQENEWANDLRKDPYIDESLDIIKDLIQVNQKK